MTSKDERREELRLDLEATMKRWARMLRLSDWDIILALVESSALVGADRRGDIIHDEESKRAVIQLLDPAYWDERNCGWEYDVERTLVHELLHLHFVPFHTVSDTPEGVAEEQAAELIAGALVACARGEDADEHNNESS